MRKLGISSMLGVLLLACSAALVAAEFVELNLAQDVARYLVDGADPVDAVEYFNLEGDVVAYEFTFAPESAPIDASEQSLNPVSDYEQISGILESQKTADYFTDSYKTIVMAADTQETPKIMEYQGLPMSARLRAQARDYVRTELGGGSITSETYLFFKIGFVFLLFEVDHQDLYLFSPRGKVVQVPDVDAIEYRHNPALIDAATRADQELRWQELIHNMSIGNPLPRTVSYTIPDAQAIRDIFYNRGTYWPQSTYPYMYEDGDFTGCCTANSGLQICLYYDDHGYDNLVVDPNTNQANRLAAMGELVREAYAPGESWTSSVADFARLRGYTFNYYYNYYVNKSTLKTELNSNHPCQYQVYSTDSVVVSGSTYEHFAHSIVAVGYNDPETGRDFTVTLYWGWSSFPEVSFNLDSTFAQQFETQNFVKIVPVPSGDQWDPTDNIGSGATRVNAPTTSEKTHGPHILSSSDQYDWFKVYLRNGYTYVFHTQGGTGDNYGELYTTASGSTRVAYNDDGGGNRQFKITYTATKTAYHYLRVRAYSTGGDCSYTLKYKRY